MRSAPSSILYELTNTNIQSIVKKKEKLYKSIISKLSNLISVIIRSLFDKRIIEENNKIKIDLVKGFKLFLSSNIPKKNINVAEKINNIENLLNKKKKLK